MNALSPSRITESAVQERESADTHTPSRDAEALLNDYEESDSQAQAENQEEPSSQLSLRRSGRKRTTTHNRDFIPYA